MTAEAPAEQIGPQFSETEPNADEIVQLAILAGDTINDARLGKRFEGLTVRYEADRNTASWEDRYTRIVASQGAGTTTLEMIRKEWKEAGAIVHKTVVSIIGAEGHITCSVARDNGQPIEPERTEPLDKSGYELADVNLAYLSKIAVQERLRRNPARGWLKGLVRANT